VRWLLALLVAALGVALGAVGLLLLGDGGPDELLPDLDQAEPSAIAVVRDGDSYLLTFASAVDNVGSGPLLIEGERPDVSTAAMAVTQLVRRTDGSTRVLPVRAHIHYVREESHEHWHLLGFESYELRRAANDELVRPDQKTGFCLGDRYRTDDSTTLPNEPPRPVWTEECGRNEPGLLSVAQGISPGYGDDYVPRLEGQYVDVTSVPAGRYLLVHRVNPDGVLEEETLSNNAASALIRIRRDTGDIPTVSVLARCPASDSCAA
jgi:hypothetical protein